MMEYNVVHHQPPGQLNDGMQQLGNQLLEAAKDGDTDRVRHLMSCGAPFTTDWLGTTALHFACQNGHRDAAEVLLKNGVTRDTRNKVDRTALHMAACEGHLPVVQLLLDSGADVDAKDMLGMTPLHWAIENGHKNITEVLLANGADPGVNSRFDRVAMDMALDNGRLDILPVIQNYLSGIKKPKRIKQTPVDQIRANMAKNANQRLNRPVVRMGTPQSYSNLKQIKLVNSSGGNMGNNLTKVVIKGGDPQTLIKQLSAQLSDSERVDHLIHQRIVEDTQAIQWLEEQAIENKQNDNDTLFNSAQVLPKLTEAGRLALNSSTGSTSNGKDSDQPTTKITVLPSNNANGKRPMVTIHKAGAGTPDAKKKLILVNRGAPLKGNESLNVLQKIVNIPGAKLLANLPPNIQLTTISPSSNGVTSNSNNSLTAENEKLKKEIANTRKEMQELKQQIEDRDNQIESLTERLRRYENGDLSPSSVTS